tara:strand:- start:2610 stop:2990 length:381 start_codon:yes stop_codon:yes gene_type:complete
MFVYLVHSIRNALDVGRKYIIANGRELGFDLVINYGRQNTVGNFPNYSHSRREIKMKQENENVTIINWSDECIFGEHDFVNRSCHRITTKYQLVNTDRYQMVQSTYCNHNGCSSRQDKIWDLEGEE